MERGYKALRALALVGWACAFSVSAQEANTDMERPGATVNGCAQTGTASYAEFIKPGWANESPGSFIVAADSQYPRVITADGVEGSDPAASEARLRSVFTTIAGLRARDEYMPVFINGDITEFGHGEERRKIQSLFPLLHGKAAGPLFFPGLGNHDYENNVGNCANNGCARDSICDVARWTNEFLPTALAPRFADSKGSEDRIRGSMSYSFTMGQVHFVQLNNYITYRTTFSSTVDGFWGKATFQIDPSLRWLEGDLREARRRGLIIFLNLHDRESVMDAAADAKIRQLVEAYGVTAVFAGHLHEELGYYPTRRFGNVPVFQSGALFKGQFLILGPNYDAMQMTVHGVKDGAIPYIRTIPLRAGTTLPPLVNDFSDAEMVFYEGPDGGQKVVCNVMLASNPKFNMNAAYGCSNDEAKSLIIMKAKRDTFISVYGNYDQNGNQRYATIEVMNDILLPEVVGSFDRSVTSTNWKIIKYGPEDIGGSISSVWVRPYGYNNGYATLMEHTNHGGNVVCTEMLSPDRHWNLGGGCANDEISSVILHQVRAGTNLCLFGNWDLKEDEGFTCIQSRRNFNQLAITNLDGNYDSPDVTVYHYGGRINGKVSSMKIHYIPLAHDAREEPARSLEISP